MMPQPEEKIFTGSTRSNIALALSSGVMLGFAFPPSPLYSLAYVALIPFLLLLERLQTYPQVLRYTYLAMLPFHFITLYWVGGFVHLRDYWLMASGTALLLGHPAFYWLATVAYFFTKRNLGRVTGLVSFPFFWIGYEYIHSLGEISFPWITLGNSQAYDLYRIQIAEFSSVYGISLLILAFNILAYILLTNAAPQRWKRFSWQSMGILALLILVYLTPLFYGKKKVSELEVPSAARTIRVGIIQPNVDPWEKWGAGFLSKWDSYERQLRVLIEETKKLTMQPHDLIVWPETAIPYNIVHAKYSDQWLYLKQQIDSMNVPVFSGIPTSEYFDSAHAPVSAQRIENSSFFVDYYNSAILIRPHEQLGPIYKKIVLVPFGERVPYAETFSFLIKPLKWGVGIGSWGKGKDTVVFEMQTKGGSSRKFSGMICYESVFPDFVRGLVERGAAFLIVITNDSWWGHTSGAYQHASYAAFRAAENRRWIVRCANGGISGFVDPVGRIHDATQMYTVAGLSREIQPNEELTFYAKHGDVFAQFCLFCSGVFLIISVSRKFQSRSKNTSAAF